MPIITIYSPSYCQGDEVIEKVAQELEYSIVSDQTLYSETKSRFQVSTNKLKRTMHGPASVLDRFTLDKELNIAYLRSCLADLIKDDRVVYHGYAGHLLSKSLTHVLRVCLAAKVEHRVAVAKELKGISEKEAKKLIHKEDQSYKQWTLNLFDLGPWDKRLYDMVIPMDSIKLECVVEEIINNVNKPPLQTTPAAENAMNDFLLACTVSLALVKAGHQVEVENRNGNVTLVINRYMMRLESYEKEISKLAANLPGVKSVKTKVGPRYYQPSIYPKLDLPRKILLVDDEKEFVHTLSERLQTRNLEPAVAYDGEQALSIVQADAPDVMVLDLKMPGIDGLEVLRRVKRERAHTEVIILTGHGSRQEQQLAEELGAFAYLNKPVDIDVLAETMKKAYAKVTEARKENPDQDDSDL